MAAPEYVPVLPGDKGRVVYESPNHVPDAWQPRRPAELPGRQPTGPRLGYQGPDQGFALRLATSFHGRLRLVPGEHEPDVTVGCVGIALRRASLFGRAPMIHDLTLAFTIWGFLDDAPPAELVALRREAFAEVGHIAHHYEQARAIADRTPEATLRLSLDELHTRYPGSWRELVGP